MPEADTALAQAAIYLATAPKSNAVYAATARGARDALRGWPARSAAPAQRADAADEGLATARATSTPTTCRGHDGMDCLPPSLRGARSYEPTERGFEKEIKRRLDRWEEIKARMKE